MEKTQFAIADDALALAKKKGAQEAAARMEVSRDVELSWRDGKVETAKEATTRRLSLQLYVDGRYGTASTSDIRPEALDRFVADAIALTRSLAKDPFRTLPDPKLYEGQAKLDLELADSAQAKVTPEKRREAAAAIEAAARTAKGKEHIVSVSTSWNDSQTDGVYVTSNGFRGARVETYFGMGASVSVNDPDGRKPEDGHWAGTRFAASLPAAAEVGSVAAERAIGKIGSKKPATATLPMIVENRSAGRLIYMLFGPMSAGSIQQKRSFLEDKLGKPIGSKLLTVKDDPLVPRGLGSRLFDGEGLAAKPMALFEDGVLRTFFVDTYYGKKLGMKPTTAYMSNLTWKLGEKGLAELVADVKDGILVNTFLGGNSNGTTGDFSLGVAGFAVRGGKIAEPVSELNIAGNQMDFWESLAAVGNDPYPYSSTRMPTLVFEGVKFAGA